MNDTTTTSRCALAACSTVRVAIDMRAHARNAIACLPVVAIATWAALDFPDRGIAYLAGLSAGTYLGLIHNLLHGWLTRRQSNTPDHPRRDT